MEVAQLSLTTVDSGLTPAWPLADIFPQHLAQSGEQPGPGFGAVPIGESPTLSPQSSTYDDTPRGYGMQGNLGVQQELGGNMVIEFKYHSDMARQIRGGPTLGAVRGLHHSDAG